MKINSTTFMRLTLVSAVLSATALSAQAATASSSFNVTLTVTSTCSVSTADLGFGSISTGATATVDATAAMSVSCSNGVAYSITLNDGQNGSGGQRRLRRAATGDYVNYDLYSDSGRSVPWTTLSGQTGTGSSQNFTVYGRVPASQTVSNIGNYSDQVLVTVTY